MPVKWTAQLDQVLLIKIIEIKCVHLNGPDAQKIIDSWPDDQGETPTVRALQEHIRSLRKNVQSYLNGSTASVKSTPRKATASTTAAAATPTARKPATQKAKTPTNKKRKRGKHADSETDDDLSGSDLSMAARGSASPHVKRARRAASSRSMSRMAEFMREMETTDDDDDDDNDGGDNDDGAEDGGEEGEAPAPPETKSATTPKMKKNKVRRALTPEDSADDYVEPPANDDDDASEPDAGALVKTEFQDLQLSHLPAYEAEYTAAGYAV